MRSIPLVTGGDGPADQPPGTPGGLPEALLEVATALNGRLGLHALLERIDLAGGKVELRSNPGEGTCLHLSVPADLGGASQ